MKFYRDINWRKGENRQNLEGRMVKICPWIKTETIIKLFGDSSISHFSLFKIFCKNWNMYYLCWLIKPKRRYWSQQRHIAHCIWHECVFAFWLLILAPVLQEGHWAGSRIWLYSLVSQTKAEVWQVRKGESNWIHLWLPPTLTHATMPHKEEEDKAPKISPLLYLLPI